MLASLLKQCSLLRAFGGVVVGLICLHLGIGTHPVHTADIRNPKNRLCSLLLVGLLRLHLGIVFQIGTHPVHTAEMRNPDTRLCSLLLAFGGVVVGLLRLHLGIGIYRVHTAEIRNLKPRHSTLNMDRFVWRVPRPSLEKPFQSCIISWYQ
jgi:hypothetical protein